MRKYVFILIVAVAGIFKLLDHFALLPKSSDSLSGPPTASAVATVPFQSGQQAQGKGTVTRILPDDNDGSRHQRFIIRLASGQTLLIAHNIDLASRVQPLAVGDEVSFYGQYEWNDKGGVIHWTHQDPNGRHVAGWLKRAGRTFD